MMEMKDGKIEGYTEVTMGWVDSDNRRCYVLFAF